MEKVAKLFARIEQTLRPESGVSDACRPSLKAAVYVSNKTPSLNAAVSISNTTPSLNVVPLSNRVPGLNSGSDANCVRAGLEIVPNLNPDSEANSIRAGLEIFPKLVPVSECADKAGGKSFLRRTAQLFETGRQNQNRLMFLVSSVFLGLVVFTQICAPLFSVSDQLQFSPLNPPQLAGDWVVNDVSDSPGGPHNIRFTNVQQHYFDLHGRGTDEFGDFELVGKLSPPNKIHLVKIHDNPLLQDTQIMDGDLTLDSTPLYAHGSWTRAHAIDASKESLQAEGYWDANFYSTKPQPHFYREGVFSSPGALMTYLRSGHIPDSSQEQKEPATE
ncbi:MAG: hypothetical protein U0103_19375 [Candidatus Obscuribacterales bacterium]